MQTGVPDGIVERLAAICLRLPEAHEEPAWVGTRWRVRQHTFAHVLRVEDGRPQSHARLIGSEGPATVLTFRLPLDELEALKNAGGPYLHAHWGREVCAMTLDGEVDWDEIAELLTESYRFLAPAKLAARVGPPTP